MTGVVNKLPLPELRKAIQSPQLTTCNSKLILRVKKDKTWKESSIQKTRGSMIFSDRSKNNKTTSQMLLAILNNTNTNMKPKGIKTNGYNQSFDRLWNCAEP